MKKLRFLAMLAMATTMTLSFNSCGDDDDDDDNSSSTTEQQQEQDQQKQQTTSNPLIDDGSCVSYYVNGDYQQFYYNADGDIVNTVVTHNFASVAVAKEYWDSITDNTPTESTYTDTVGNVYTFKGTQIVEDEDEWGFSFLTKDQAVRYYNNMMKYE